jgi:hypothetical protein
MTDSTNKNNNNDSSIKTVPLTKNFDEENNCSNNFPKFSFLITFYNQDQFVDNCMECIKKLKIPTDYEIIAGNDGSTDKTKEKLENWKSYFGEEKFKIITANRNDGCITSHIRVSNLRKSLLKESSGDYLLYLDGDDFYCDSDFIVDSINLIKKNPNISVIMFKHQKFDGENITQADTIHLEEGLVDKSLYIRSNYVNSGACVFKRIKSKRFNQMIEKSHFYTDNIIIIYNLCFGDLWYVPKNILNYRISVNSMWNSMKEAQQILIMFIIFCNVAFFAKEFKDDIYYHYKDRIFYSYFIRKNMENIVGKEFLNKYIKYSTAPLVKTIIDYNNASEEDKEETDKIIQEIKNIYPDVYKNVELKLKSSV